MNKKICTVLMIWLLPLGAATTTGWFTAGKEYIGKGLSEGVRLAKDHPVIAGTLGAAVLGTGIYKYATSNASKEDLENLEDAKIEEGQAMTQETETPQDIRQIRSIPSDASASGVKSKLYTASTKVLRPGVIKKHKTPIKRRIVRGRSRRR